MSCQQKVTVENELYLGVDLSYVNEIKDCGGVFRENGKSIEPYNFFAQKGADMVRVRLWHNPDFGSYSDLKDIKLTIHKAKENNQSVLLDFHYSDTWADPGKQLMPKAWQKVNNLETLGDSVYNYTYYILSVLQKDNLTPNIVQIGNETNNGFVENSNENLTMNWERNSFLFNKGLEAVEDFNKVFKTKIETMLHVAQPENAIDWFNMAKKHDVNNFEWIGLSYYPNWSEYGLSQLGNVIRNLDSSFVKKVMVVETAYPYSNENFDEANNILSSQGSLEKYPVSPEGQLSFMLDLKKVVMDARGKGIIYWEPAWVSTPCQTHWGTGSHWENAAFFDASNDNEVLPVINFFNNNF